MSRQQAPRRVSASPARAYEHAGFWLGRERHSDVWSYYWYDEAARRTRRKTTGKRDLEEAKLFLHKHALRAAPKTPEKDFGAVTISKVRIWYLEHHGRHMRSAATARAAFDCISAYLRGTLGIREPTVADFTLAQQEGFMRWAATQRTPPISAKSISTYLIYYSAALRFAAKPRMVPDGRGATKELRLLEQAPFVQTLEGAISKVTGQPTSKPRAFVPSDAELARMLDHVREPHVRRYCIMALNLWARPEAIMELRVSTQVDFDRGLVHLNPPGRRQNNKVRPTVRLTDNLRAWLTYWNCDAPVCKWTRDGRNIIISKIDNRALKEAAASAGLDPKPWNRYVFRHFMATRVRAVPGIEVSREQRAEWMGHADPEHRTTQRWYESMDEDHLLDACRATDAIMTRLAGLCRSALVAPRVEAAKRMRLVENG